LIILGIDPGIASTGYGLIEVKYDKAQLVRFGEIKTSKKSAQEERLKKIYEEISEIIRFSNPDRVALESIFYSRNIKSLVLVGEAIGVISLAAINFGLNIKKFTPLEVKSSIVGFGKATKSQVQLMITNILDLDEPPKSNHASDALAVAMCYKNLYC